MHPPERAEQARVRFGLTVRVVQQADERRQPEGARDQHGLVVGLVARLAERDHIVQRGAVFFLRKLRVAHEAMHVANECSHDLPEARIRRALQLFQDGWRDVFLSFDDHGWSCYEAFFFSGSFTASNVWNSTLNNSPFTFSTLRM